jgi:hypothetical protein
MIFFLLSTVKLSVISGGGVARDAESPRDRREKEGAARGSFCGERDNLGASSVSRRGKRKG